MVLQLRITYHNVVSICSRVEAGTYALFWEQAAHMTIAHVVHTTYVACTTDEAIQGPHTVKIINYSPNKTRQAIFQALQLYSWGFAMLKIYLNKTRCEICMDLTRRTFKKEDSSQCAVMINPDSIPVSVADIRSAGPYSWRRQLITGR